MRVLLTGGHEEHEWDFYHMFRRLGHDVVQPGMYGSYAGSRPAYEPTTTPEQFDAQGRVYRAIWGEDGFHALYHDDHASYLRHSPTLAEFVWDRCRDDIEYLAGGMDVGYGFIAAWAAVFAPALPFILHLNGQFNARHDDLLAHVADTGGQVVAYAREQAEVFDPTMPVIHFGRDPDEWCGWRGDEDTVVYACNAVLRRAEACQYDTFIRSRPPRRWVLMGKENDGLGSHGTRSYADYQAQMRRGKAFFNLGTVPASYTLTVVEAAMTGMPVLTEDYEHPADCGAYAVPRLLGAGCVVYREATAHKVARFLGDGWYARRRRERIGREARAAALKHFAQPTIDAHWREFMAGMMA